MGVIGAAVIGLGFFEVRKVMTRSDAGMCDSTVLKGVWKDTKDFCFNRWRDLQAMQILAMRCSAKEAQDAVVNTGTVVGAAAAATTQPAPQSQAGPPLTT